MDSEISFLGWSRETLPYQSMSPEFTISPNMLLPTDQQSIRWFVQGLRLQLPIETESMVSTGLSFLDVLDHVRNMEQLRREAQWCSDKRARY